MADAPGMAANHRTQIRILGAISGGGIICGLLKTEYAFVYAVAGRHLD